MTTFERTPYLTLTVAALVLTLGLSFAGCGNKPSRSSDGPTSFTVSNAIFAEVTELYVSIQSQPASRPALSWKALDQPYLLAAIFSNNVQVDKQTNTVSNTEQIVWFWHNGLPTGRDGAVKFSDGFDPHLEAEGLYTLTPQFDVPDLPSGTYVLVVWALDRNGEPVAASREMLFTVP